MPKGNQQITWNGKDMNNKDCASGEYLFNSSQSPIDSPLIPFTSPR
ncbi:MAG: hypothetical protein RBS16_08070 [Candidatus Cloacimonadales bacterium]|nr:hypothetical protein [Candidatus Cloacimonadota bacterium]MDD2650094.1 hypothetical protein [Candidatus Cloacimonadota bacterium]MDX9977971.1 hypothetical protein [Candidatus Cloacimonadales bacterium]